MLFRSVILSAAVLVSCGPTTMEADSGSGWTAVGGGSATGADAGVKDGGAPCVPEFDEALCQSARASCGAIQVVDRCGTKREVGSCGTCTAPSVCERNQCTCHAETDLEFCARQGKSCGSAQGTDNCGVARVVTACGQCSGSTQCQAGTCACPGETDRAFCTRLHAACGPISGKDLCDNSRNVSNCGDCAAPLTCGGGGTAHVCGCAPLTDTELCVARGKNCGALSVRDNCGTSRTIQCGTCTVGTCGAAIPNVCGCTAETDSALCARLNLNCGGVTTQDNCGRSRTISSCGTCTKGTCGGAGTPNVCGCAAETDAELCLAAGAECGGAWAVDRCGTSRSVTCGSCVGPKSCTANNRCELPLQGLWTREYPSAIREDLTSVSALSPTNVWAVGSVGTVVHWDGVSMSASRIEDVDLYGVFAAAANDVWAVGAEGRILHFDGARWTRMIHPAIGRETFTSVWGASASDVWITAVNTSATGFLFHWDGTSLSASNPKFVGNGSVSLVVGAPGGRLWAFGTSAYQFNGLEWVMHSPSSGGTFADAVVFANDQVWGLGYDAPLSDWVGRWNGTRWSTVGPVFNGTYVVKSIWGATSDDVWLTKRAPSDSVYHYWSQPGGGSMAEGAGTLDVHGTSASDVWLVGTAGQVLHWNGSKIEPVNERLPQCTQASVAALDEILELCGNELRWVNLSTRAATPIPLPMLTAGEVVNQIWATVGQAYAVTSRGKVLSIKGLVATVAASYSGSDFRAVFGLSVNDVWVGTSLGSFLHWNGTSWTPVSGPTRDPIATIGGSGSNALWAAPAAVGYALRYDGQQWVREPHPAKYVIREIRAMGPNDVWVTEGYYGGTVFHYDGTRWVSLKSSTVSLMTGLWPVGPSEMFAFGNDGYLYHSDGVQLTQVGVRVTGNQGIGLWANAPRDLILFTSTGILRYR